MGLREKYQLLDRLADDESESYRVREIRSGREVTAHLLPGLKGSEQCKAYLSRLIMLPPSSRAKLIEVDEDQGRMFVVVAAPPFLPFMEWLQVEEAAARGASAMASAGKAPRSEPADVKPRLETAAPAASAASTAPVSAPPRIEPAAQVETDEFSRFFPPTEQTAAPASAAEPGAFTLAYRAADQRAKAASEPPPTPSSQAAVQAGEPGEFTRLFQTGSQASAVPSAPIPEPVPPAVAASASVSEPGEFTKLFQTGPQPLAVSTAPTPAPSSGDSVASEPGDFTKLFQTGPQTLAARSAPPLEAVRPAVAGPASASAPGEFTRLFESGPPSGPLPSGLQSSEPTAAPKADWDSPSPAPAGPGEFTRLFQTAQPASPAIGNQIRPPAPPPVAATEPSGEFTQIFGRSETPTATPFPQSPGEGRVAPPAAQPDPWQDPGRGASPRSPAPPFDPPAAPPMPPGPSEYTRIMAASAPASASVAAGATLASPPALSLPKTPQVAVPAVAAPAAKAIAGVPMSYILLAIAVLLGLLGGVLLAFVLLRH